MNAWEITAVSLSGISLLASVAIAVGYSMAGGLKLIPNFSEAYSALKFLMGSWYFE